MIAISLSGEEAIKIRVAKAHAKVREEKEMEVGGTWGRWRQKRDCSKGEAGLSW